MELTTPPNWLMILVLAMALDAAIGDPAWLWRRLPHPVTLIGKLIEGLDRHLNRASDSAQRRRLSGALTLCLLVAGAGLLGWAVQENLPRIPHAWMIELAIVVIFLAQRSLYDHVAQVVKGFEETGLEGGRAAVSKIVGRDPDSLDEPGVCRATIESLAENFSDGVVAPVFWYLLLGLPGLLIYKTVNTADSMIGHRSARYADFAPRRPARRPRRPSCGRRIGRSRLGQTGRPQAPLTQCRLAGSRNGGRARLGPGWPTPLWRDAGGRCLDERRRPIGGWACGHCRGPQALYPGLCPALAGGHGSRPHAGLLV